MILLFLELMRLKRLLILFWLVHAQIGQQFAAGSDLAEQSAASGVILLMLLEVLGQEIDLFGKDRNLNLRGTGIFGMCAVLINDLFLLSPLE